jgi:hypothetical protein
VGAWWARLSRNGKVAVVVGGVVGGVLLYKWYKARQAAAASSSTTGTTGTASTTTAGAGTTGTDQSYTPPTATVTLPGGASYSGPAAGLGTVISQLQPPTAASTTPTPAPSTGTAPAAAPSGPGYGEIPINGADYVVLGPAGGPVYQVGGGAPVYFGNADQIAEGSAAEAAAAKSGGYAYTPVAYSGLVASTPMQQAPGQF